MAKNLILSPILVLWSKFDPPPQVFVGFTLLDVRYSQIFLYEIHSTQGWTTTTRHRDTGKET